MARKLRGTIQRAGIGGWFRRDRNRRVSSRSASAEAKYKVNANAQESSPSENNPTTSQRGKRFVIHAFLLLIGFVFVTTFKSQFDIAGRALAFLLVLVNGYAWLDTLPRDWDFMFKLFGFLLYVVIPSIYLLLIVVA